jgi:hypothetical protein
VLPPCWLLLSWPITPTCWAEKEKKPILENKKLAWQFFPFANGKLKNTPSDLKYQLHDEKNLQVDIY